MDADPQSFYDNLGFELVEIDDKEVLFLELHELGDYAVVSDDEGNIPTDLENPVIWSVYDENDSFQWSVTLESSQVVKALFDRLDDIDEVLDELKELRLENITKACEY